ncbi:mRNA decay activator protein ZFP36L1-like [Astyanax mexicanus]|uniref:mRNA decay activator protein ZFP36 n=1 Tax=Astyanax mexicanus TaxID=7994 RepID=A0A8B9JV64_ASTMX|nr:mRNA decay activator protein ZFP36L1-like [Astyanax mexicanus]
MPSNFLTPFLELDDEFCKSFRSLDMADVAPPADQKQRVAGFQRRHSLCPVTLPNSKFNCGSSEPAADSCIWPMGGIIGQQLPRSSLNHIPFRVDRSISMIEGHVSGSLGVGGGSLGVGGSSLGVGGSDSPLKSLPPPPGLSLSLSNSSLSSVKSLAASPPVSTRYKTELCRTYEESGTCKYGAKCQFAHGMDELRGLNRHPKYKTEPCRTFHTIGFCPYGARCHFIHNADEQESQQDGGRQLKPRDRPQLLRQSVSFAGFSSQAMTGFQSLPDPLAFTRAASISPPPSTGSPDLLSPMFPEPATLKNGYRFSATGTPDLGGEGLRFFSIGDPKGQSSESSSPQDFQSCHNHNNHHNNHNNQHHNNHHSRSFTFTGFGALQRTGSADSLSDQEGYSSSTSTSSSSSTSGAGSGSLSGSESPTMEGRRLPIFSRLSVSDD